MDGWQRWEDLFGRPEMAAGTAGVEPEPTGPEITIEVARWWRHQLGKAGVDADALAIIDWLLSEAGARYETVPDEVPAEVGQEFSVETCPCVHEATDEEIAEEYLRRWKVTFDQAFRRPAA